MIKKNKIGKIVTNYKGYKLRHLKSDGGRIGVFTKKKQMANTPDFGSVAEALTYLRETIDKIDRK